MSEMEQPQPPTCAPFYFLFGRAGFGQRRGGEMKEESEGSRGRSFPPYLSPSIVPFRLPPMLVAVTDALPSMVHSDLLLL
jgi:hypothetical protein